MFIISKVKQNIKSEISPGREHVSDIRQTLHARMDALRANRETETQKELEENFLCVLLAWGIQTPGEVFALIRAFQFRCFFLALAILFAVLALVAGNGGIIPWVSAILITTACLACIVVSLWRIWILKHRRFVSFQAWLFTFPRKKLLEG